MNIDICILFVPLKKLLLAIERYQYKRKEKFLKETREWIFKQECILKNKTNHLNKLIIENEETNIKMKTILLKLDAINIKLNSN